MQALLCKWRVFEMFNEIPDEITNHRFCGNVNQQSNFDDQHTAAKVLP